MAMGEQQRALHPDLAELKDLQSIVLDIEELKKLLSIAQRTRVRSLLSSEISNLQEKLLSNCTISDEKSPQQDSGEHKEEQQTLPSTRCESRYVRQRVESGSPRDTSAPPTSHPFFRPSVNGPSATSPSRRAYCLQCRKHHKGPCHGKRLGRCYICGAQDHWKVDCPKASGKTPAQFTSRTVPPPAPRPSPLGDSTGQGTWTVIGASGYSNGITHRGGGHSGATQGARGRARSSGLGGGATHINATIGRETDVVTNTAAAEDGTLAARYGKSHAGMV